MSNRENVVRNAMNLMLSIVVLCMISFFAMPACAASNNQFRENQMLQRINMERAAAGVSSVTIGSASLTDAANARAEELSENYSYVRPNGKREFTILEEYGVNDITVGENYWAGSTNSDDVVDAWMNYEAFRERLLDKDVVNIGVGYYEGGRYGCYWVVIFTYPENTSNATFAQEVLDLVNIERAKYGLNALEMGDANLNAAAALRAEEIAEVNSHTRPDGTSCFTVLEQYNVTDAATGENAAWGSVSPEQVVSDWMNSEGHRANILNPEARKMSVGYCYDPNSEYGHQWIQIFTK